MFEENEMYMYCIQKIELIIRFNKTKRKISMLIHLFTIILNLSIFVHKRHKSNKCYRFKIYSSQVNAVKLFK